jgi:ketosteroid isomerase-like protein
MQDARATSVRHLGVAVGIAALSVAALEDLGHATGVPEDRAAALTSMADAERAFAQAAGELGIRDAFIKFLDDDAVGFQPTLGRAKEVWRARPAPPNPHATKLEWEPRTGDVAASGDLGWLTGPYTLTPQGDATHTEHGCYFSVWRRADGGRPWLVMLDQGISLDQACAFPEAGFHALADDRDLFTGDGRNATASLLDADRAIARAATAIGPSRALLAASHERVRLLRNGRQPMVGADARGWLEGSTRAGTFTTANGDASRAGDVGYTYGSYSFAAADKTPAESGYYVRVWRRRADGTWRITVDVLAPTTQR